MKILTRNEFVTLLKSNPGKKFVFQENLNNTSIDPSIHITSGYSEYPTFGAFYIDTNGDELTAEYDWDLISDYTDADMFNVFDENDIKEVINLLSSAIYSEKESEDCISRQEVLRMQYRIDDSATLSTRDVVNVDDIEDLQSVTPKSKTGHWIHKIEDWNKWTCSKCAWSKRTDIHVKLGYSYCPNCGAKMMEVIVMNV